MNREGRLLSSSPEETLKWAEELAGVLEVGDTVLLSGSLGAGKTLIARGIAKGLGYEGIVASPSFTLMKSYPGRLTMYHCDLYRMGASDDLRDLGIEEFIEEGGVAVFEWSERFPIITESVPRWEMQIDFTNNPSERVIKWKRIG